MSSVTLYDALLSKIQQSNDNIKEIINKIKNYTNINNSIHVDYLQHLNKFSQELNQLEATSQDLYDIYILKVDSTILSQEDLLYQKNLRINKYIEKLFLPYILYLQIHLQNN